MKPWNVRLALLLGITLVAVLAALAVVGPVRFIRMPDGVWLRVRVTSAVEADGVRYRYYVWGSHTVVRVELDIDRDGRDDLRGDDWQRIEPRWCWSRGPSGWEPAPPAHCAATRSRLIKMLEESGRLRGTGREAPA